MNAARASGPTPARRAGYAKDAATADSAGTWSCFCPGSLRRILGFSGSLGYSIDMSIPRSVLDSHPGFLEAVAADGMATLRYRGDGSVSDSKLRILLSLVHALWASDAFFAQVCYRAKASLQRHRIPILPRLLHRLAMMTSQVCIGDPVVIGPGLYLPHGQVVVDGIVTIGRGAVLFPWTTIGLRAGIFQGPTLGTNVHVGTGSKLIGPIHIGDNVMIGANAVVTMNIPADSVAVGVPAVARPRADVVAHVACD